MMVRAAQTAQASIYFFLWGMLSIVVNLLNLLSRHTLSLLFPERKVQQKRKKQPSTRLFLQATVRSVLSEQQKSQGLKEPLRGQPHPNT